MSSRVLSGTMTGRAQPIHWLRAFGDPVNAEPEPEAEAGEPALPEEIAKEIEGSLHRIQVLERRIKELEAELPRRHEAGRLAGRAEGEQAGEAVANAALQPLMDRLTATLAELSSYRARFRRESEPELLVLALAVAKKILRRELTVDPHSILGILKAALETINQAEVLCIRCAPDDAPLLASRLGSMGLPDAVEVTPDRMLVRGSVILETKRGQIDASVHTQLKEIENGFADRIAIHNIK